MFSYNAGILSLQREVPWVSQALHLWLYCWWFCPLAFWVSSWTQRITLCRKKRRKKKNRYPLWRFHFLLLNLHTQPISNEARFTPLRVFLSSLWILPRILLFQILELCTLEDGSDGVSVWSFLEFNGLHYPKLWEIEGNTVGLNPGVFRLTV